jgi:hypothetical protein
MERGQYRMKEAAKSVNGAGFQRAYLGPQLFYT